MDENKTVVTREGYEKLKEEFDYLTNVERQQVILELQNARAQGDLSENADYDAARDHQARVESRIKLVEQMLSNVEIIEENRTQKGRKIVRLGSVVKIHILDEDEVEEYCIVGTVETDPDNGKISNETPLAIALLDHKVNDKVTVYASKPYDVKILEIN
ncbi:MAG: transcription elongation factor GreA [Erysipelotrichaceae bacterium]|nr:transcription elongation factor GreA [Erysipelotrichaceae bacterium]